MEYGQFDFADTSLGRVVVARLDGRARLVFFANDDTEMYAELAIQQPNAHFQRANLLDTLRPIVDFVESPRAGVALCTDLAPHGTPFQQRVWKALVEIPCGTTISYTELARRIGAPDAVRAAASACGANPCSIVVPCHRVVRNDGSITGYRWGAHRKRALLLREATNSVQVDGDRAQELGSTGVLFPIRSSASKPKSDSTDSFCSKDVRSSCA